MARQVPHWVVSPWMSSSKEVPAIDNRIVVYRKSRTRQKEQLCRLETYAGLKTTKETDTHTSIGQFPSETMKTVCVYVYVCAHTHTHKLPTENECCLEARVKRLTLTKSLVS